MVLMAICGVLVLAGLVAIVRWGGLDVQGPPASPVTEHAGEPASAPAPSAVARRYLWWVTLATQAGLLTGLSMSGAGGRLAMRLLAVTAGDAAQGRETEAEEIVGEITLGGTIGLFIFVGLLFGLATAGAYLLVRRWLPGRWWGGLLFGAGLLVVFGTRADPLRPDNPDFGLVGPGWLAIIVFSALVIAHGLLLVALFARLSRALPLIAWRPKVLAAYSPLVLLLLGVTPAIVLLLVGLIVVGLSGVSAIHRALRSRVLTIGGRVVLAGLLLISMPTFVSALVDIART